MPVLLLVAVLVLLPLLGGVGGLVSVRLMQVSATPPVGTLSFVNSGVDSTISSQEVPDEIKIQITLDRPLPTDMAYYAWLMPDQNDPEGNIVPLGRLGKTGTLSYSDPTHTNLLLAHGSLLITEQPVSPLPHFPLLENARYQAVIPQLPGSGNPPYTLLDHLRHLLANDPELENYQLEGGLAVWMVDNTKQIATWALDAQKAWQQKQANAFHQDLLAMVDYLAD